jgi:hypothetical protein
LWGGVRCKLNQPWGLLDFPEGILNIPQGILNIPEGILNIPQGILDIPQWILNSPQGILDIPQGKLNFPWGIVNPEQGRFNPERGIFDLDQARVDPERGGGNPESCPCRFAATQLSGSRSLRVSEPSSAGGTSAKLATANARISAGFGAMSTSSP